MAWHVGGMAGAAGHHVRGCRAGSLLFIAFLSVPHAHNKQAACGGCDQSQMPLLNMLWRSDFHLPLAERMNQSAFF
jgi:hypothetical protein